MTISVRSSSSDYASNSANGKIVVLDSSDDEGPSEVMSVRRRNIQAESSPMGRVSNSRKDKGIGALNGAGEFHEISGGNVVIPNNLGAESSHMAGINNIQLTLGTHREFTEAQGPEMDEMIATLLVLFPWLSPDQALSQLLKTWGKLPGEMVLQSTIDHFLQNGSSELVQDEGQGEVDVEGAESSVQVQMDNPRIDLSEAGPSYTLEEDDYPAPSGSGHLYREWCFYTLSEEFPLVKMSVLRQAFKAHNGNFTCTYKAVQQVCRDMQDSLKRPAKEEAGSSAALQNVNWIPAGGLKFMKAPRPMKNKPYLICSIFEKEWAALQKDLSKHLKGSDEVAAEGTNQEGQSVVGDIECGCCYCEFSFEEMVQCADGHLFCSRCLRRHVEEITFGGFKSHASIPCMDTSGCNESIPLSEVRRALPNDVIERYEQRQAQEAIVQAKLEDLVYCPFCNFPCEVDKDVHVLECPNPKCLKDSCTQCKEASHIPLRCEEVEKISETALRRKVEEMMTKAVIRECNSCKSELIKTDGCNKVTCRCGSTMCYVCRQTISRNYSHFCQHTREPGKPCQTCNLCSLWEKEVEDNVALAAKEEALKQLTEKEPKLLDRKIGPPLKRQRQPTEGHTQRLNFPFVHIIHGMPPFPHVFGGEGLNMNAPDLLPLAHPEIAHPAYNPGPLPHALHNNLQPRQGIAARDVPPPHFFRLEQLANMAVPQPALFEIDQLANRHLQNVQQINVNRPVRPQFFRLGDQLADERN
jgi:TRIAD3 protein (E3 ubiquitin-protein ligase RNF216)